MLELLKNHEYSTEFEELVEISKLAKELFRISNPMKYAMYGGNCCRQIAFISKSFLEKMIPEYKWTTYESTFLCAENKQEYEHAWCYGTCDGKKGILVDLAFDNGYNLNYLLETDTNKLPCNDVESIMLRKKHEEGYFEVPEYYTGLLGSEIIKVLTTLRKKQIKMEG